METQTLPFKNLEFHEARYWSSIYLNAGEALQRNLGLAVKQINDSICIAAQTLLIAARINDAIDLGCRYISTETSEDRPDNPLPSFRNMERAGFSLAYLRPNFIYQFFNT